MDKGRLILSVLFLLLFPRITKAIAPGPVFDLGYFIQVFSIALASLAIFFNLVYQLIKNKISQMRHKWILIVLIIIAVIIGAYFIAGYFAK